MGRNALSMWMQRCRSSVCIYWDIQEIDGELQCMVSILHALPGHGMPTIFRILHYW